MLCSLQSLGCYQQLESIPVSIHAYWQIQKGSWPYEDFPTTATRSGYSLAVREAHLISMA